MFDLERAIADWRLRLAAQGMKNPEVLDELESHLRDEVEERINSGASPQRAFETATEHFGRPAALQAEFAKLKPKAARARFLRGCYYFFPAAMLLINTWTLLE